MDPPSYNDATVSTLLSLPNTTPASTTTSSPYRRSILDLRALILGNANILRPRDKNPDPIELIVAKRPAPQASAEELRREVHYAFLVTRSLQAKEIEILLKGNPRDTVEEALEDMLERSELLMEEVLLRHGAHVRTTGCCLDCTKMIRREREGAGSG